MERYVIRGGEAGYVRLQVLARAQLRYTSALLDRAGVAPGMRCLDVGCGSGDVTFEIAGRVGPAGHVTGLHMDAVKLSLASAVADRLGHSNVDFRAADVTDWNEEAGAYDVVYARFLLQHLRHPVALLRMMWTALRPGGVLIVEDADFDGLFCHPPNDGFEFYARNYAAVLRAHGGDPATGRKLLGFFFEAGIPAADLDLAQRVDAAGEGKTMAFLTLEATAEAIVDQGLASANEVEAALTSLREFTERPDTVLGDPRTFQVWARR